MHGELVMIADRLLLVICSLVLGMAAVELLSPFAAQSPSRFVQRIEELKAGRLPPEKFVRALERYQNAEFARAVCRHSLGQTAALCREEEKATLGWALCAAAGRSAADCLAPKQASLGFGICMAGGRDLIDCQYVDNPSTGFGLCMAARRSFHECTAETNPSIAFAYCMEKGESLSHCLNQTR